MLNSEQHLFHSFIATTTKINNVWIMPQKKRLCIHLSPCYFHARNKEQASGPAISAGPQRLKQVLQFGSIANVLVLINFKGGEINLLNVHLL